MVPWLHGTLYVTIHEARNVPIDRLIRLPDKVMHRRSYPAWQTLYILEVLCNSKPWTRLTLSNIEGALQHILLSVSMTNVHRPSTD